MTADVVDVICRNLGYLMEFEAVSGVGQDWLLDVLGIRHVAVSSKVKAYYKDMDEVAMLLVLAKLDDIVIVQEDVKSAGA
jgi:hypothetical protein